MRLVFCGTPEFAVPALRQLLSEPDFTLEAVVTQPDRSRGRGLETSISPVKAAAAAAGLPVYQPEKVRADAVVEWFERIRPDAVVIIAYGQIIPARLLRIPPLGWINLHASLLPKYRGAAPIAWAIANGETRTGLTTMQIDAGMDTGPILLQAEMEIGADETAPALSQRMAETGAPLIVDTLRGLGSGALTPRPQDNAAASYAPILKREHGQIVWTLTAQQIHNRIRGFAPWPGAFTQFRGRMCHVWGRPRPQHLPPSDSAVVPGTILVREGGLEVACGEATLLELEAVQLEGRKRVTAREFVNGARLEPGERFGGPCSPGL